ncbi:MAG: uroporphyrinogen-III synthase [Coriobacteriia bacterium]|nr:uroporphyrinogen-III synthase [Coriobacteriia bacterium]
MAQASSTHDQPLAGRTILVTRANHQSRALSEPLRALGATVIAAPVIAIVDPEDTGVIEDAVAALSTYDWVVLTSVNAVERFTKHFPPFTDVGMAFRKVKVAVVGTATARALEKIGVCVDLVPDEFCAEGLIEAFRELGAGPGWRILVPRALEAREVLPETLRGLGCSVDVVPVYRTVAATPKPHVAQLLASGAVDVVTFTSPSTVRHFSQFLSDAGVDFSAVMSGINLASIGPVTTDALRDAGFTVSIEAEPSTIEALVGAIVRMYH